MFKDKQFPLLYRIPHDNPLKGWVQQQKSFDLRPLADTANLNINNSLLEKLNILLKRTHNVQ